tara:strand:- start:1251 stop:2222 length:972 start_codon:yes stop_codon:yes gene_type:complete
MSDAPVIAIDDVHKTFRRRIHALRGVSMRVNEGEIFGLLGPNGAGKSTLVKILMTVIRPSRLTGTLLGKPVGHKPTLRHVGYLPEHHQFPKYLTAAQVLDYFAALSGVHRAERRQRTSELLELVGMKDWARHRVGSFSKGMLQRIGIAQALMNDPRVLVLDEPTDGVDPVGRREIRDLLIQLRERGHTIFINSHLLSELEMVCDRVSIMVKGQVSMEGTIDELTASSHRYMIVIKGPVPESLSKLENMTQESVDDDYTRLFLPTIDAGEIQSLIDQLRSCDTVIRSIEPIRESLEDLFMRAVKSTGDSTPGAIMGKASKEVIS